MTFFMRHMHSREETAGFQENIYSEASTIVQNCSKFPSGMFCLLPSKLEKVEKSSKPISPVEFSDLRMLTQVVSPSDFGSMCIAREMVLKYKSFTDLCCAKEKSSNLITSHSAVPVNYEARSGSIQLVNIGLNCMYNVLLELSEKDPQICSNALSSLYNLLQSLAPDDLANEPYPYVTKLFTLLKGLRNSSISEISSKASCCMLSLAVAYGSPELLLSSATVFLTTNLNSNDPDLMALPKNYKILINQIFSFAAKTGTSKYLNRTKNSHSPNWFTNELSEDNFLFFIAIFASEPNSCETGDALEIPLGAFASDGTYLYILTNLGLYKIGSGFSGSIYSKIYARNLEIKATSDTWLSVSSGSLYLRRWHSTRIWVLDSDSLREIGEILLAAENTQGALFTDGSAFHIVTITDETGKLILSPLTDNFSLSSEPELEVSLTQAKYTCFGEEIPQGFCSKLRMPLSEQVVDLQVGGELAFLLTHMGKVYYCGKGSKIAMQDTKGCWMEIPLADPIASMSVSQDSNNVVFRSCSGQLWYAGSGFRNDAGPFHQPSRKSNRYPVGRPRKIPTPNHKKIISCAAAVSTTGFVTENGRVFLHGRHVSHCHPDSGQVLGLEQVHLITLSLGKTHAVAVSRHGHVYTWGLNNLYQCGRAEPLGVANKGDESSDPSSSSNSGFQLCPPMEHMWVKDVATLCTACGLCSAHGIYCPVKGSSPIHGCLSHCGPGESGCLRCGVCRHCGEHSSPGSFPSDRDSDQSSDISRKMVLGPARLIVRAPIDVKITKVSCGNYHTLLLSNDRQVCTSCFS